MPCTLWTPDEDQILRLHYGKWTLRRLARVLGRTECACDLRARRLGVSRQRPDLGLQVRTLHSQGLADPDIARQLQVSRTWAGRLRRRLGLVPHRSTHRELSWRARAELLWPGCRVGPTDARILARLEETGPAATRDLADVSPVVGQHLSSLRRRELVGIARWLTGRGGRAAVWTLDGPALAAAQRRKQQRDLR